MERASVRAIVQALDDAGVRCLVAGGLAAVAHGHVRFTTGVDLVIGPADANVLRAIDALAGLGYRPREHVPFEGFAHAGTRAEWAKRAARFTVCSERHRLTDVHLLLEPPLEFEPAWERAVRLEVAPGLSAAFVAPADLVQMKRRTGRPQDLVDLQGLLALGRPGAEAAVEPLPAEASAGLTLAERRRLASLPLADKLAWLEEAHRLACAAHGGQARGPAS